MTKSSGLDKAVKEMSSLVSGRFISESHLDSIRNSLSRGEVDTMAQAAAGGVALAISILEDHLGREGQDR